MRLTRIVESGTGPDRQPVPRSRERPGAAQQEPGLDAQASPDRSGAGAPARGEHPARRPGRAWTAAPVEFAATVVGGQPATVDRDGFTGYLFAMAARSDGRDGSLVVQRADDPVPEWQPYCLVWGGQEGTTYGGVCRAEVGDGEVVFELLRHNAAELGTPTLFRISFPPRHTEEVRAGLRRTLGDTVVS